MDLEIRRTLDVVKCPNKKCSSRLIRITEGHYVGGINDKGGIVVECDNCGTQFGYYIQNPQDLSRVSQGGKVVGTWDGDLPEHIQTTFGISSASIAALERVSTQGLDEETPRPEWHPAQKPVFEENGVNLEMTAQAALKKHIKRINKEYHSYYQLYVKGSYDASKSFVVIDYKHNTKVYRAVFAKQLKNNDDFTADNLYLIYHSGTDLEVQVDGIYKRDEILVFLGHLLNRWQYTADETLLVVPFIGVPYPGAEKEMQRLWDWVAQNVDSSRCRLITRRGTFNMLKNAQIKAGIPFDLLVEWGLIEPLVAGVSKRGATFQPSHAKYYVGIFEDYVEVLVGSFNIHAGEYFENISFKRYSKDFFERRYLHMLPKYTYPTTTSNEQVHYMMIDTDRDTNWVTSLGELLTIARTVPQQEL
ncbi:hypothetical protein GCM10027048_32600 [Hymenobacter coalescens]